MCLYILLLRILLASFVSVFIASMPQWLRVHFCICVFVTLSPHHLTIPHYNFDLVSDSLDMARMYINLCGFSLECIIDFPL